jgi:hypothetical protein
MCTHDVTRHTVCMCEVDVGVRWLEVVEHDVLVCVGVATDLDGL